MIAGLLLAAGGARRFGSQKLIARLGDESVVHRAAVALAGATDTLIVVVGSDAEAVRAELGDLDARVVVNDDWQSGLASSLLAGVAAVDTNANAILVALGDQPGLDPRVVRAVIDRWKAGDCAIVAARYRGEQGHPVLFARSVFSELATLTGDRGAKPVIERDALRAAFVDIDAPAPRDVDTRDDLDALREAASTLATRHAARYD